MDKLRDFTLAGGALTLTAILTIASVATHNDEKGAKQGDRRPKLTLKATPLISIAPSRVVLTAELTGGANDFEDYYCPAVEWDWGDGTESEASSDCEPYQPGRSEIKRRFTVGHVFRAGNYRVVFRLKRYDRVLAVARANIQVRSGAR